MTAGIEISEDGTKATYAGARELPWHMLGTTVDHSMTAEEALTLAHLAGWDVRKEPIYTGSGQLVPDNYAMVRNNPFTGEPEPFAGVVGKLFEPVQNEDHAEFLNNLTEASGAHIETAGSIDGGKKVFVTMKMPEHVLVGGSDPVDTYISAFNSHDGNSSFTVITTKVRVVCKNTLQVALSSAKNVAKVRHTAGMGGAVARVRDALGVTFRYSEAFDAEVERMIESEISSQRFGQIISQLYPTSDKNSELVNNRAKEARLAVRDLYQNSPTNTGIRGTAWAGYNAVTEYVDYFAPTRGKEAPELVRARYNIAGRNDDLKTNAFRLFANA